MLKVSRDEVTPVLREAFRDLKDEQYKNDVDPSRSDLNYTIGCQSRKELVSKMQARCEEIMEGKKLNKTAKPLFSWVVTYPVRHPEIGKRAFFEAVNDFMVETYGKDNVMAVCVHMDETTPHAHCFVVPEAISRKNGKRTVSVASLLDKEHLQSFHGKMDDFMYERFGVHNTVSLEEHERVGDNLPMLEHKKRMLEMECSSLENKRKDLETEHDWLEGRNKMLTGECQQLEEKRSELKEKVEDLEIRKNKGVDALLAVQMDKVALSEEKERIGASKRELEHSVLELKDKKQEVEHSVWELENKKEVERSELNRILVAQAQERNRLDQLNASVERLFKQLQDAYKKVDAFLDKIPKWGKRAKALREEIKSERDNIDLSDLEL